jgi:adenylylsulfate kinase
MIFPQNHKVFDNLNEMEHTNLSHQRFCVTRSSRNRLTGHPSFVVWFTGLSGSGKSTLSNALEICLHDKGYHTYILDGDNIRRNLNRDLGFSENERMENLRRAGEVCRLLADGGLIVIAAFISPSTQDREMVNKMLKEDYVEIYLKCPLRVCEERDVKGLYKKAREGQIENFTGVSALYQEPVNPSLTINTDTVSIDESVKMIVGLLSERYLAIADKQPGLAILK